VVSGRFQERGSDSSWHIERNEAVCGEQVVLAAFVDDSQVSVLLRSRVGQHDVELLRSSDTSQPVLSIQTANRRTFDERRRLVDESLPLEFFLANAVRLIPMQLSEDARP
jgi:hypothetical protein